MRATRAEIDLSAIQYNLVQVRKKVGPNVRVLGVVKANAYGHGLVATAQAALDAGVEYFGVAFVEEGLELRKHTDRPILVFSPPLEDSLESFVRFGLDATITSLETAYSLDAVARGAGKKVRVQVNVDTGMGRLGFFAKDAVEAVRTISRLDMLSLAGVYSHFATSDEYNKEFARRQLTAFRHVVESVKDIGLGSLIFHIANSGAVLDLADSYFDMVRPGIMVYGYYPSDETSESVNIKPALSLRSVVTQMRTFSQGTSVSYGRRYFTRRNTRVAVIPIGYGDGFTRMFTGKASVLIRGKRFPVVGTITMDHIMCDVGNDFDIQTGDDVTLIGQDGDDRITARDLCINLGTIPYEVLCMLNSRIPRVYNISVPAPREEVAK